MNKNILAIGIIFLFTVSSIAPMVIGYKVETTKDNFELDKSPDEYKVTIEGGIGITITVIYEGEFDDDLYLSLFLDGFIIFFL
ncbi:MAG: hypothetical protein JSV67_04630 [Thermoplasmatales archaeon]|nr:MAG: hypothetical protein JSV67_04630 [Thermoplasmatales archaeon]